MKYALCLALAGALATGTALGQMGPPIPMTAGQFANSTSGQDVILAVRVDTLARTTLDAELLERVTDSRYRATHKRVVLYLAAETPFVMGSIADVKPGAIVFVYGVTTTAWHADVKKVVVVTPFAKVE
jgi:hypothetical protein